MKPLLATLLFATAVPLMAGESTFKGPSWDNLAIPLKITPFYIQIDHPTPVTSIEIEMDMFINGEFKRTISTGGLTRTTKPSPLNVNAAIYFMPPDSGEIEFNAMVSWNDSSGFSRLQIKESELPITKGVGSGAITEKIKIPGRTPIFRIIVGDKGFTFPEDPFDTPKENPETTVLIGYLKAE